MDPGQRDLGMDAVRDACLEGRILRPEDATGQHDVDVPPRQVAAGG